MWIWPRDDPSLVMEASRRNITRSANCRPQTVSLAVNVCVTMNDLIPSAEQIMPSIFSVEPQHKYTDCVEKVIKYIGEHLSDSNLSLKWISENSSFMNPGLCQQNVRQTDWQQIFRLCNRARIQEAKKLLLSTQKNLPYAVAEMVGFGNNLSVSYTITIETNKNKNLSTQQFLV